MDTISTNHQSMLNKMSNRKANHLGAAARRAMTSVLSAIYEPATRNLIQKQLQSNAQLKVLHYLCGSGEDTFLLASLLGQHSNITAIDNDNIMIEKARHKKAEGSFSNVRFFNTDQLDWTQEQQYDLIFTSYLLSNFNSAEVLFQSFYQKLNEGGTLIIKGFNLNGYTSYPYNHAFARSAELLSLTQTLKVNSEYLRDQLKNAFLHTDFRKTKINVTTPTFIEDAHKTIVSLLLEATIDKIIGLQLTTTTELDALLLELRHFEKKENTLISSPGMYQIIAKK